MIILGRLTSGPSSSDGCCLKIGVGMNGGRKLVLANQVNLSLENENIHRIFKLVRP